MSNDLLIKINADAENAKKAFEDLKSQTESLNESMNTAAKVAGVAFAALTAEILVSAHAAADGEKATRQLTQALQNQGIYSAELVTQYREIADAIKEKTGVDDDAIVKAQAVAQTYLGHTKITKELTLAIVDLAEKMGGDLNGAAEMIGRTIGTNHNVMVRQGLQFSATATEAEKMAKVLEFVNLKAGGMAEAANQGMGGLRGMTAAFEDVQKAIGAHFTPILGEAIKFATEFFSTIAKNKVFTDLATSLIVAGAVVSGLALAISLAVPAFTALTAAMAAFGVASNIALAGIPIAIGLVAAGITYLALNWEKVSGYLRASMAALASFVTDIFGSMAAILKGAFTLDLDKLNEGIARLKGSLGKAKDAYTETFQSITETQKTEIAKQDDAKAKAASKEETEKRRQQALLVEIEKGTHELLRLQNENASKAVIDLKTKEVDTLKALEQSKNAAEIALLKDRLAIIKNEQVLQGTEEIERAKTFEKLKNEAKNEAIKEGAAVTAELSRQKLADIEATAQTELDIDRQLQEDLLTQKIQAHNTQLLETKKYGEAYAILNKGLQSTEIQGAKTAAADLVQLQQSKNAQLKEIGKIAAVAQITISTSESAMNIFKGFSSIPYIGYALGIAGAAAAVAFGAERIGQVTAAADGGLIEGGIPGRDSVPALLMPGELVVPKRNFNDVVGAVQGNGGTASNKEMVDLLKSIDTKFSNPQTTVIKGDVMTDESYIDALVRKISDAIEFRNGKIYGVVT